MDRRARLQGSAPRTAIAVLAAAALLSGCSSTLRTDQAIPEVGAPAAVGQPPAPAAGGAAAPGATAPAGTTGQPGTPAKPVPAGKPGAASQPGAAKAPATKPAARPPAAPAGSAVPAAPRTTSAPRSPIPVGHGVTDTTIRIGVFVASYAGLEAKGLNLGDAQVQAQAVADYLNARGGIAGRKIVLSFAKLEASSSNWESDEQKICTTFTEDQKVFAVVYSLVSQGNTLLPCLAQHDTPLISGPGGIADANIMSEFANYYYYTGGMELSRMSTAYVDGLAAQGFFAGGGSIGLVRADSAPFARAARGALVQALRKHGLTLAKEAVVDAQTSVSKTASQMPSVVLKFQQAGVKKVLFLDNGTMAVLFAIQAASQRYYPQYGLSSLSAPAGLMQQNVPPEALAGAKGVGWVPALDVDATRDANNPNPVTRLCTDIMTKAGQGDVSGPGHMQQRMYCDELFLLKTALDGAAALTPKGLRARVDALGTSYNSAITFSTRFASGRHDGAAAVRYFGYTTSCKCFTYAGSPRGIG